MEKVILAVLDGVGFSNKKEGNAFKNANTPNLDRMIKTYPNSLIEASGKYVGLPDNQMGNSEVGHLTIGAGRVINQSYTEINRQIESNEIYDNKVLKSAMKSAKKGSLHLFCMISDGGVHSHINHLFKILDIAKQENVKNVYIHAITDGRDTYYKSALKYLDLVDKKLKELNLGSIATLGGRYYYMDRDSAWDRTYLAYNAMVYGKGKYYNSYTDAINDAYNTTTDEFIKPCIINKDGIIKDGDTLLVVNFRPDRLVQILTPFVNKKFNKFKTKKIKNLKVYSMCFVTEDVKTNVIIEKQIAKDTLTEVLSKKGIRILRVAEESKWAHVTHFLNGDKEVHLKNDKAIIVPKKNVSTYDLAPEMSAKEITDTIEKNIKDSDFVVVNYANGDMVGHTGNYDAALIAMEKLDVEVGRLEKIAKDNNFILIITADHGNVEEMISKDNKKLTYHTNNKVYLIVCDDKFNVKEGSLSDIAPSILNFYNIKSNLMTGKIIIDRL